MKQQAKFLNLRSTKTIKSKSIFSCQKAKAGSEMALPFLCISRISVNPKLKNGASHQPLFLPRSGLVLLTVILDSSFQHGMNSRCKAGIRSLSDFLKGHRLANDEE